MGTVLESWSSLDDADGDWPGHVLRLDERSTFRASRAGREVFVVSDLHLGPPAPFGFPTELVPFLLAALREAAARGAILILNGDILDVGPTKERAATILGRYPRLRDGLRDLARQAPLVYVAGNHDPSLGELAALDLCETATAAVLDDLLVVHGHELDLGLERTLIGRSGDVFMRAQQLLGARVDSPYTKSSSVVARSVGLGLLGLAEAVHDRTTDPTTRAWLDENLAYLCSIESEQDPRHVLATLARTRLPAGIRFVACGHTHRPGIAGVGGVVYVNSGTWSPELATVASLEGDRPRVTDALSGRGYGVSSYEGWHDPRPWKEWIADTPTDVRPILRDGLDRAFGRWARFDAHAATARLLETASSMVPGASLHDGAATPNDEGSVLGVRFTETLRGTWYAGDPPESAPATLTLTAVANAERDLRLANVTGKLDVAGLARDADVSGSIRLVTRGGPAIEYALALRDDEGRALRIIGSKLPSFRDTVRSLTTLRASVLGDDDAPRGELDLAISVDRDLGRWIRSVSVTLPAARGSARCREPFDPAPRAPVSPVDPHAALRVVVTGASGHLGYNLVAQLLARGHRVRALVRGARTAPHLEPLETLRHRYGDRLTCVDADLLAPASLRLALESGADVLIHTAAALKFHARDEQRDVMLPNVQGTTHVLRAAYRAGIPKVVLTSSVAALGNDASGRDPLDERDWNQRAKSAYARSKTEAERRAWDIAAETGLDLVTVQPGTFLGPNYFRQTAATRLIAELAAERVPAVPPMSLPWVDVRDVAWIHLLLAERSAARGRYPAVAYHLSFDEILRKLVAIEPTFNPPSRKLPVEGMAAVPLLDWLQNRLLGTPRNIDAATVAENTGKELRVSAARTRAELGWEPIEIDRTLGDSLRWARERFLP